MARVARALKRLVLVTLALTILGIAYVNSLTLLSGLQPDQAVQKDFGQDYLMARAFADGQNPYQPIRDLATRYLSPTGVLNKAFPSPHPPSVSVLFLPFLLLDYAVAVKVWFGIETAALIVGVFASCRAAGIRVPAIVAVGVAFAVIAWLPVMLDLLFGQLTVVLLALLAVAELALVHQRPRLAGCLLGLSLLLKPLAWPWLLVVVYRRSWNAVGVAVLIGVLGFLLPALRIGANAELSYFTTVLPAISQIYAGDLTNLSWWSIGPRLFQATTGSPLEVLPLQAAPVIARLVGFVLPAAALVLAGVWLIRARPRLTSALAVATAATIVLNPISWLYYLSLLIIPISVAIQQLRRRGFPVRPTTIFLLIALGLQSNGTELLRPAQQVSAFFGAPAEDVLAVPSLLTLEPGVAAMVLAIFVAVLDVCDVPAGSAQA